MKTLLFVDDEPKVLQGLQRQLRPMRHEWDMHFLEGGRKALEFMAGCTPDVIVSDMMMPGMDGAQLLTEVSQRFPHTVRIVLSGHADREAILRLVGPAHQYLSKPCDAEELRNAIARALALRDLLANEQLKQLATRIKTLPSLPTLYTQLSEELQREEPSMERAAEIISRDMGMTTKMLQLVNSAFFGLPQRVSGPAEAVMYLGLTTVRSLVLSLEVFSQFNDKSVPGFSLAALAEHSYLTALFARRLAQVERLEGKTADQCFVGGLLHDVGRLVLVAGLPEEYEAVLANHQAQGVNLLEAENAQYGATHAEVGAFLLGLWGLTSPVIEAVAFHHRPAACPAPGFSPVLCVHVANALAHQAKGDSCDAASHFDHDYLAKTGLAARMSTWQAACALESP